MYIPRYLTTTEMSKLWGLYSPWKGLWYRFHPFFTKAETQKIVLITDVILNHRQYWTSRVPGDAFLQVRCTLEEFYWWSWKLLWTNDIALCWDVQNNISDRYERTGP